MRFVNYKEADKICVIDLSNLSFICHFGYSHVVMKNGDHKGHVYGFLEKLVKMVDNGDQKVGLIFCMDTKPTRRKEIFPEYKTNRPPMDFNPLPDIKRMLKYLKCTVMSCEGEEADDIIATFCKENIGDKPITVYTSDRDIWQVLWQRNVRLYNILKKTYVKMEDLEDKFALNDWRKILLWKSVLGDSGDNIPSAIPRVRKKVIVPMMVESDGTIEGFYEVLNQNQGQFTDKMWNKVVDGRKIMERNYKIVKLNDEVEYDEVSYNGNIKFLSAFIRRFEFALPMEDMKLLVGLH